VAYILNVKTNVHHSRFYKFKVYLKNEKELVRTLKGLNKEKYIIDGDIELTCEFISIEEITKKPESKKHMEFGK